MDKEPPPTTISVILPARNEEQGLRQLLPRLRRMNFKEIIVVDDGSEDGTARVATENGIHLVAHPLPLGNGAAVKSGTRTAKGDILVFIDADSQHDPDDIPRLVEKLEEGFDMAVGARAARHHASFRRRLANGFFNRLASMMTGFEILDLTSGFRAVRASHFRRFLYLLPNGFSYPSTITMAFFRSAFPVAYVPIVTRQRAGHSKIRLFHDGIRFMVIILKIGTLFSPMRFFLPISAALFVTGLSYYAYTFFYFHRFTNMSALLFIAALLIFSMGLLSEQISSLHYRQSERDQGTPS